jgi:GAF domain-containing protein
MSVGTGQAIHFLQQENLRLKEDKEKLQKENRLLNEYMQALYELFQLGHSITSEGELLNLLDKILYDALTLLDAEDGSLMLQDEDTNELVFVLVHGDVKNELRGYRIQEGEGIAGWVAREREAVIVNDPHFDDRFSSKVDTTFGFHTRSIVAVPLLANTKVIGVMELINKRGGGTFTKYDLTLFSLLASVAASTLENVRLRLDSADESGAS